MAISLESRPNYVNDCNCSLCIRSGALWGYFSEDQVSIEGRAQVYQRSDRETPVVNLHFCGTCGTTTHWTLTTAGKKTAEDKRRMGVNMNVFDHDELKGVELRFPDGAAWDGGADFGYIKPHALL